MHTLFVGHNPSISTWETGHYFANPTNHFWKLITKSGLIDSFNDEDKANNTQLNDDFMVTRGFGFIDFIERPGNDANAIIRAEIDANRAEFPKRIEKYAKERNNGSNNSAKT